MLVVGGVTYRIERAQPHSYVVVRLLDDCVVGTFRTLPILRLDPIAIDASSLRDVVRAAMRAARTSAVTHAVPVFRRDDEAQSASSPSTVPPRTPVAV